MTHEIDRRRFLEMAMCGALAACGGGDSADDGPAPPPEGQIDKAIAELGNLADDLMAKTGVPGMAIAVVRGDRKVYAKGSARALSIPRRRSMPIPCSNLHRYRSPSGHRSWPSKWDWAACSGTLRCARFFPGSS